jgi:hypothetical protein
MKETKEILLADYSDINEKLKCIDKDDNAYSKLLEDRRSIRDELVKMEGIESENRRDKIRNIITVGTFTITSSISVWGLLRTLRFDENATITSTAGRGIVSDVVLKMFKK